MTTAKPAAKAPAKKAAPAAKKTETDVFAFPSMPAMEVPPMFRDMAENTMTQSKEAYEKFKQAAEETSAMVEASIEKTRDSVVEMNSKAIEMTQENTDAALSHAKSVFAVKTLSEVIELQTAFMTKQMEVFQGQAKSLQDMTTKFNEEAAAPYKDAMKKTMDVFKVA